MNEAILREAKLREHIELIETQNKAYFKLIAMMLYKFHSNQVALTYSTIESFNPLNYQLATEEDFLAETYTIRLEERNKNEQST